MSVFACTSCGWVQRSPDVMTQTTCPVCESQARCLTPAGSLTPGRAALAAATARALHAPGVVPLPVSREPDPPRRVA